MSTNASTDDASLKRENLPLEEKADGLRHDISSLASVRREAINPKSVEWARIAFFGFVLFVSSIPSFLVLRDRWLEKPIGSAAVNQIWWNLLILRSLAYPQYFLLIFVAIFLVAVAILIWRNHSLLMFSNAKPGSIEAIHAPTFSIKIGRYLLVVALVIVDFSAMWMLLKNRIPGWDLLVALLLFIVGLSLLEDSVTPLQKFLRTNWQFLIDAALLVIALCGALYTYFGDAARKPNAIFYFLLILALLNFLRHRRQTPPIFWISIASLVALTWDLNSWHYVVIGDEYSFYTEIRNILDNRSLWQLINATFDGVFVYGTHPYFSSYIQDFFMKLFDNHNFGWRFSNPFLVAFSLPFFYYFFKAFVTRRIALVTVILLGFSHYLLSFSKIGYNNLQALFAMGLVLASFTWALKSMKPIAFSFTGLAMGFCFYVYPAALYVVPLPIIGFLVYVPPKDREALKRWGWMIVSAAILIYPLMIQPHYWEAKIAGTFLYTDASNSAGMLFQNVFRNMLYSSLSYLYIPEQTHFVSTGYLDPLSSVFVVIGFVLLLKATFQRNRSALFLMLSFLAMFVVVGATHGRNFPTATRMFLLLPWFMLFTVLGLEWTVENIRLLWNGNPQVITGILVALLVLTNLYNAYTVDVRIMARYHTLAPLFIKTVREINANPHIPPKSYAFIAPAGWNVSGMEIIQKVYLVPDSPRQLINLPLEGNQLPLSAAETVKQPDIVVIVNTDFDKDLVAQVDSQLIGWGKSMCEIRNGRGTLYFQLWHSGDLGWLCK